LGTYQLLKRDHQTARLPGGPDERARVRGLTIVVVTFLLATAVTAQLKASLVPASNRVARDQQLVNSAQALEQDNTNLRGQLHALQDQIQGDNQRLAQTSQQAQEAQLAARDQKEKAGLTKVSGPGISVDLANGNDPHVTGDSQRDWLVKYLDIQDVVNLLWSANAEAISVNGQRVVNTSSLYVAGTDVLLNGVHLASPYHFEAIGDGNHFNDFLSDPNNLSELKTRSDIYQLKLHWQTERDITLPAFDGAFIVRYAVAG
jgi:uncharacterized protein YlxW (UPF0749 family)